MRKLKSVHGGMLYFGDGAVVWDQGDGKVTVYVDGIAHQVDETPDDTLAAFGIKKADHAAGDTGATGHGHTGKHR
jgi:hypothetical protein